MRQRTILVLLSITMTFFFATAPVDADEHVSTIDKFMFEIAEMDEFSSWEDASAHYAYDLYGEDLTTVNYQLFYVTDTNDDYSGYMIYDCNNDAIVELSRGEAPYDLIQKNACLSYTYLYHNGWPECYVNGAYFSVNYDGSMEFMRGNTAIRSYDPHLQGGNCIVGAISNLLWYHGHNGYPGLTSGVTFSQVENRVDSIITWLGGYANNNIPQTISTYVNWYSSYSVSVTNHWNPTFSLVSAIVNARPCLLGFAAGSPYSPTVGHMTVCVDAMTQLGYNLVGLMDGHHTYIVYKEWGTYNDFAADVVF